MLGTGFALRLIRNLAWELGGGLSIAADRLTEVGGVLSLATDGAFFPDGRHLVEVAGVCEDHAQEDE